MNYSEIKRLEKLLEAFGVKSTYKLVDGLYDGLEANGVSVICTPKSYGGENGLLEAWSPAWEDAIGYLTASDALWLICYGEEAKPHHKH